MNASETDIRHMHRAIELARRAEGRTHPNPMVGCVIVDAAGDVVAEGHHEKAGGPHAEVVALRNVASGVDLSTSTLYVNLEPCSHHNRTPPCSDAIIDAGVGRVVLATIDPNPRVSGRGIERMRAAGIEVSAGVLEDEARELNRAFFKYITTGLPLVVAKYAMTLDGRIASRSGSSKWITGEQARERVHHLRNTLDAIMVGARTLALDDPRLTCRINGGRDPVRALLDAGLDHAPDSRAVEPSEDDAATFVFAGEDAPADAEARLAERGVRVVRLPTDARGHFDLRILLQTLARQAEITSVLVEGGGELLGSLFDEGLIDRVVAFVAPIMVGGHEARSPILGLGRETMGEADHLSRVTVEQIGDDVMISGDLLGDE